MFTGIPRFWPTAIRRSDLRPWAPWAPRAPWVGGVWLEPLGGRYECCPAASCFVIVAPVMVVVLLLFLIVGDWWRFLCFGMWCLLREKRNRVSRHQPGSARPPLRPWAFKHHLPWQSTQPAKAQLSTLAAVWMTFEWTGGTALAFYHVFIYDG